MFQNSGTIELSSSDSDSEQEFVPIEYQFSPLLQTTTSTETTAEDTDDSLVLQSLVLPETTSEPHSSMFLVEREAICRRLFVEYNKKIFGNKLPQNVCLSWSKRMFRTSGTVKFQKRKPKLEIVLASQLIDGLPRLQSTLCSLMCHAAARLLPRIEISLYHSDQWLAWARLAIRTFPDLILHKYL